MTTTTTQNEITMSRELDCTALVATVPFLPRTDWAPLEEDRTRHERALAEMRDARREEGLLKGRHRAQPAQEIQAAAGRVLDGDEPVDPAAAEDLRVQEMHAVGTRIAAARVAMRDAVVEALQLIEANPAWLAEVDGRIAAAAAEHDELLAQAAHANATAHAERHMAAWLRQAATAATPQPFAEAGPLPSPPQTVQGVFGSVAS